MKPAVATGGLPVHGHVAPGFEAVGVEFEKNFARRGELGAACAVYRGGEKVVDLWGGYRDLARCKPWEQDTHVLVYSVSKGLTAMAVAAAHGRGLIDLDERVAAYWPEFAQNAKGDVTVRQLLAHQAGVPTVDERLTVENMADPGWLAPGSRRRCPSGSRARSAATTTSRPGGARRS